METEDFLLQMEREIGKYKCSSQKDSTNSFLILHLGICLMGIWQVCIYVLNWKKVHQKLHFHIQFCSYFHVGSLRNVFIWFLWFINQSHARSEKIYDLGDKIPKDSTNTSGKFRLSSLHIKSEMLLTCRRRS